MHPVKLANADELTNMLDLPGGTPSLLSALMSTMLLSLTSMLKISHKPILHHLPLSVSTNPFCRDYNCESSNTLTIWNPGYVCSPIPSSARDLLQFQGESGQMY